MRDFIQIQFEDIGDVSQVECATFSQVWSPSYFRAALAAPNVLCVGSVEEGELGAYALGFIDAQCFSLSSIAVAPRLWRRGHGEALLRYALAQAVGRGCASARLEVRASNSPALSLYHKVGFTSCQRLVKYYDNPLEDGLKLVFDLG